MDRKTIMLILSSAVFGSFFLPLFDWHSFQMNGVNYILSTHIPPYKFFLLLIPFSTIVLFVGALENEHYLFSRNLLCALPLLVLIFVLVMKYINREPGSDNNIFADINFGYWLILGFSILLILTKGKQRIRQY